ncbi:hypothetical protein Tco_0921563 [Tanacetum coccineum]
MDDSNITMEEYIRLEEEKSQKRGRVFNWETAKYGKIWYDEDIHNLRSVETEFPAIAFNDGVSSKTLSYEPTVSSLNDEIDFRIPFDDSDDEDYKNEFPAIVYNDAETSKSDLLTGPILSPQHIVEFDLYDETSLFEYDKEEQNVLYFNDLFPFNIIHPNDLKLEKDNDDNEVDIIQSSRVIMEYLVSIRKRRALWSLNEDILKITILTTNTTYPSRKILRIRACTHQRPQRKLDQYAISSEDQYAVLEI